MPARNPSGRAGDDRTTKARCAKRRVNWPSRAEVINSTAVVLAVVVVLAVFLAAVDVGLSWIVDRILRWG